MNILCYIIVVPLFLLAVYADIFTLVVNVRKLFNPEHTVSGMPIVALIMYVIIGSVFSVTKAEKPSWAGMLLVCLLVFHVFVHLVVPVLGRVVSRRDV